MIRINLELSAESARRFLDQLNAAIRESSGAVMGSGAGQGDGSFRATMTGAFTFDTVSVQLTISALTRADGTLEALEVAAAEGAAGDWERGIRQLVTGALAATVDGRASTFFQRVIYHYIGPALDGEYWLPGFRLAPAWPDDPDPQMMNAERVVTIDMHVTATDARHAMSLAYEQGRRNAARVSLLAKLGFYYPPAELVWVVTDQTTPSFASQRLYRGLFSSITPPMAMPKKAELCPLGEYDADMLARAARMMGTSKLPQETRAILRNVDSGPANVRDAFDRCARLWQVSLVCGSTYPSLGLAYRVAALDAVSQSLAAGGFSTFVRAHVSPADDLEATLDFLHGSVRSAHFHAGSFPAGEFAPQRFFDPILDSTEVTGSMLRWRGFEVVYEALSTWLASLASPRAALSRVDA